MDARVAALLVALAFLLLFGYLTVRVIVADGLDVLSAASVIVLAVLGFGILGALVRRPPQ